MSIADKISRLSAAKTAIATAITSKGGTVGQDDGFEDFSTAIASIPSGGGRLPSDYQEVEWLQNGDNQSYIDTGITCPKSGNTVGFRIVGKFSTHGYYAYMCGVQNGGLNGVQFNVINNVYRIGRLKIPVADFPYVDTEFMDISANYKNSGGVIINGDSLETTIFDGYDYSFLLFAYKDYLGVPHYNYGKPYISYAEITEGQYVVRKMIPCYRKSDNVAGMYDIVNDVFYTNVGAGTFTVGPDV